MEIAWWLNWGRPEKQKTKLIEPIATSTDNIERSVDCSENSSKKLNLFFNLFVCSIYHLSFIACQISDASVRYFLSLLVLTSGLILISRMGSFGILLLRGWTAGIRWIEGISLPIFDAIPTMISMADLCPAYSPTYLSTRQSILSNYNPIPWLSISCSTKYQVSHP